MRVSGLHPPSDDRSEVLHVVRHEDPLLVGSEREDVLIGKARQRGILVQSEDVVSRALQRAADVATRDVRVEEDAQPCYPLGLTRVTPTNG